MGKVVARFEKVSFEEFKKSWIEAEMFYYNDEEFKEIYDGTETTNKRS